MTNGLRFSIVMAEDDEDDRIFMDEAFNEIGCGAEIKKFISGDSMLDYLDKTDTSLLPSLIILDNTLPRPTATDMLTILKKKPEFRKIPVVIYSSYISPKTRRQLLELGAMECVEKKFTMKELVMLAREFKNIAKGNC